MTPEIDILSEDPRWEAALGDPQPLFESAVQAALAGAEHAGAAMVSVLLADDARLKGLNAAFRGKDNPTNVLSFPAAPAPGAPLGDLAFAFETVEAEAEAAGKPLTAHLTHLIVHGTLHLLGYDHLEDVEAERMESLETRILAALGIENPYA